MTTKHKSPEAELKGFIAKFTPEIQAQAHAVLAEVRAFLPGAQEFVYDNYNALAIGFCATERGSDPILSIVLYPRWISMFFLQNAVDFPDPEKLLKGNGKVVRHIVLTDGVATLRKRGVRALMKHALKVTPTPLDPSKPARVVIRSISATQRPRRPAKA
jgi:hypothetical protein